MINLENLWNKIHLYSQQYKREYLSLLENIFIPLNPSIVVELGTHAGGSFWGFCEASSEDTILISVDRHDNIKNKIESFHKNSFYISGDTQKEETLIQVNNIINNKKIDFLFIDADHTYNGVKRDFELWYPLVRDYGIIAFHDVVFHKHNKNCKVDLFWNEIKDTCKSDEYHYEPNQINRGIGVIQKNNSGDKFVF